MRQRFISFEGIDGAGKSTIIKKIAERLLYHGQQYIISREPGGCYGAEKIRDLLIKTHGKMQVETEVMLYQAARIEHIKELILPSLAKGKWVLTDRYIDSTYAYQTAKDAHVKGLIEKLEQYTASLGAMPSLTFFIDTPIDICLERMSKRKQKEGHDKESKVFFNKVRKAYLERSEMYHDRIKVIDPKEDELTDTVSSIWNHLFIGEEK